MEQFIREVSERIQPVYLEVGRAAQLHLDQLTKPPGSLGMLENLAVQLACITGEIKPVIDRKTVIVMAADHGVCEEEVSAFPQEVTQQMLLNMLSGGAAINVLSRQAGADVLCVDIGVKGNIEHPELINHKIRQGTGNMAREQAMTREQAIQAVVTGMNIAIEAADRGSQLFVTGEMGIGNTTASSAMLCALSELSPEEVTGRGTGLTDSELRHKAGVIREALSFHQPDSKDTIDVLTKVGGLEIAGLVGVILGAASQSCPVVLDGFISTVAAVAAYTMAPQVKGYLIGSHLSAEKGHRLALKQLGIRPLLQLDMRLGEGTGGVMVLHMIDAVSQLMNEMATFASAGVSDSSGTVSG